MYNVVFYSRHCSLCCDLLKILQNERMIDYFKLICVDDDLENCPVKMVPTMIVKGVPKPLQGKETLQWVQQTKFINQKRLMDMQKNMVQHNMMKIMMQNQKNGPRGFSDELQGFSDQFAYTKVDKALPHAFFKYKDEDKSQIFTAKELDTMKAHESKAIIKKIDARREEEDAQNKEMMEKKQLMEVIKHERDQNLDLNEMRSENQEARRHQLTQQQIMMQQMSQRPNYPGMPRR